MTDRVWVDPSDAAHSALGTALGALGYALTDDPTQADLRIARAPQPPPWVARVDAGDEAAGAKALEAGATAVLRWPTPAAVVSHVVEQALAAAELRRVHLELQEAQAQLLRSEKMASLGMMVAGIAHEINTPLGAIASMQDTLQKALEKLQAQLSSTVPEPQAEKLLKILNDANHTIRSATERVTTIVKRLRSFARLDEAELQETDLHESLEDTLLLMHHELKHGFTVHRTYGVLPPVACYPGRINQVFLNILMNAKQASTSPSDIFIETRAEPGFVAITIRDHGRGIPPENLEQIFEPGFTTKEAGVGVGLGLAICRQIVEQHHGRIDVESEVGTGTAFTIRIPTDLADRLADDD